MTDSFQYASSQSASSQDQLDPPNPTSQDQSNRDKDLQLEALQSALAPRYRIIQPLGKGSQGAVYLAESESTHQKVAIKQLHISSVKDWKQYDLFQREASVLKRLDIPGVAKLHETIEILDAETPMALIVQDYIQGEPLQQFINNGHRFQIGQIGGILLQLLDILQKLHQSDPQVVHRDIKPSNILLNYVENSSTPEVHLIDFGAVSNPQVKGGGSTVVGTYGYMAPEQLMGNASAASDIYSLAIVAVYLLSGVSPENLEIQDYHVLIDKPLQHLPYSITAFLRQMLDPRAENRMTSYNEIRSFFKALISQTFDAIPCANQNITKGKYTLENVHSYRQSGNIVIWQEFNNNTPDSIAKANASTRALGILKSCLLALSLIVLLLAIPIFLYFESHGQISVSVLSVILVPIFLLCFIFKLAKVYYQIISHLKKQLSTQRFEHFFYEHARKSMATVIRIEYIPIHPSFKSQSQININMRYSATWRITYSFNPPDDNSPDDLIRTVETHADPDVKEGDLIPILYQITHDETGEHVYSTPYPIPVSDTFNLAEN